VSAAASPLPYPARDPARGRRGVQKRHSAIPATPPSGASLPEADRSQVVAQRRCKTCDRPAISTRHSYCHECRQKVKRYTARERERRRKRGTTTQQGYGWKHQQERAAWAKTVEAGLAACARCGLAIDPVSEAWDLDHDDADRSRYLGASHARATGRPPGMCPPGSGGRGIGRTSRRARRGSGDRVASLPVRAGRGDYAIKH
jgi:hypothetical protein